MKIHQKFSAFEIFDVVKYKIVFIKSEIKILRCGHKDLIYAWADNMSVIYILLCVGFQVISNLFRETFA